MARYPEQLELLTWQPPRTVLPFPLGRRTGKARAVARTLQQRKTHEGKEAYWQRTINAMADELRRHGATDDEVHHHICSFRTAVEAVMPTAGPIPHHGPGAA
ncbi:DUF6074 family protein [Pelagibacterium sp.]|uniref:DUF6074 family protein n=1 Tax=Pelagibacterium sp. TaxID=1967288 RepID=UPI0032ECC572